VHTRKGSIQGYNAQAVTTCEQVIVAGRTDPGRQRPAAAPTDAGSDRGDACRRRHPQRPGTLLADAGYWTIANLTEIEGAPELLIPPARHGRQGKPRKDG
jgi:hypothetical protein